jgi:NADH-quinone oxidoreductase subunit H
MVIVEFLIKLTQGFGIGALALATGLLFGGIGRKIMARIQRRYGPPFTQNFIDLFKLFSKGSVSHGWAFDLGLVAGFAPMLAALMFLPIGSFTLLPSDSSLIMIVYLMMMAYLGMAMGVLASGNPNSAIGMSRALMLMAGYEVPFAAVIFSVYLFSKTGYLTQIVAQQSGNFMNWNIVKMPLGFLAVEIALQGMLGEKPFDQAIAPAEIASGPMVELGGKYLGFGMIQHSVGLFLETGIVVDLFLGGAPNFWIFIAKQFVLYFVVILVDAILPRLRIHEATSFFWKLPLFLGILQAVIVIIQGGVLNV